MPSLSRFARRSNALWQKKEDRETERASTFLGVIRFSTCGVTNAPVLASQPAGRRGGSHSSCCKLMGVDWREIGPPSGTFADAQRFKAQCYADSENSKYMASAGSVLGDARTVRGNIFFCCFASCQ